MKELSLTVTNGDALEQLCRRADDTYCLHRWVFRNTFDLEDNGMTDISEAAAMQWLKENHMDDTFSEMLSEADAT